MGNCHLRNEAELSLTMKSEDFQFVKAIGRGAMGKVWIGSHKATGLRVAIKEYYKSEIPSKEALHSILKERMILSALHHPFLVNINFAFQDKKKLYLGLDLKLGGDLRYHMLRHAFSEPEVKFLISCMLVSLEYIHSRNFIHKDVKPENIIFDANGYAFITDFGTAEKLKEDNSHETSGTPGYMAPEIICRQNHSFVSDFFALGVIIFEIVFNTRPYQGKNRKEVREAILDKQVKIDLNSPPRNWSRECCDLINKLLKRKPSYRIGRAGIQEIKNHEWFRDIDFDLLNEFKLKAPFVPSGLDNFDEDFINGCRKTPLELKNSRNFDYFGYFYAPRLSKFDKVPLS